MSAGSLMRVDLYLPDPDIDVSGLVDGVDWALMAAVAEFQIFVPSFALDGDGRMTNADVGLVAAQEGLVVRVP